MLTSSKIKQYYRYRRNWNKLQKWKSKIVPERIEKELKFYSQFIGKGDIVFDVGANIGDKTEIFLELGAEVIAVEPQESCWRILKRRFKDSPNVFVEPVVLAECDGEKELYVDKSSTLSSMSKEWIEVVKKSGRFSNSHKWSYCIKVNATTLDKLTEKYGTPVYCKIDVEGSEESVLKGLSRPIKYISFEFVSERKEAAIDCIRYLSRLGKLECNFSLGDGLNLAMPQWADCNEILEKIIALPQNIENYGEIYTKFSEK